MRPAEGEVLDRRTLNRALLARQLLLERVASKPVEAVGQLVGMQAQVPLDPYVGLWSRVVAFDPELFGRELLERRAVRMTLMRATIHLVSSADAVRIRPLMQRMLGRAFASSPFARNLSGIDLVPVLARGRELLDAEPMTLAQLRDPLGGEWPGQDANSLAYAVRYLMPLVQVAPRGVWGMAMQPTLATLEQWLGAAEEEPSTVDELVLRYLRAFGPATAADIRAWSWLPDVRAALGRLEPRLRCYRDETGRKLFDVPDGMFVDPETPAPVRFLPEYDNLFLSHADRGRIMDAVTWGSSFGHRGCFFVDGFLTGAWKLIGSKRERTLVVEGRRTLLAEERRGVKDEAEQLLVFLAPEGPRVLEFGG